MNEIDIEKQVDSLLHICKVDEARDLLMSRLSRTNLDFGKKMK